MSYLKKYEYVIEIAKSGGISQAADNLGMSQPTLSKYIKKLEGELGVELFDRSTIPLKLTPAGEKFIAAGTRLIDMEHQLEKQLEEIKLNKNTVISVGISPSRSPYLIPSVIEVFRKKDTSSRIVIKERTTAQLAQMLRDGELDLVISILDDESAEFERIELFDEDIILAAPACCTNDDQSSLDILRTSTLIQVGKGLNLWQTMNQMTSILNVGSPEIECQSIESALALVKRGIGATIVPSYVEKYGSEDQNKYIRFMTLPTNDLKSLYDLYKRKVCLFYRKEQFLTQSEKNFISCVKEITKK
jgi:DNA-binding transcriptional LysR family regulator